MIIAEIVGNILQTEAQTLVCPVNTVGVMGNGLALYFKLNYPDLFVAYQKACAMGWFARKGIFVYTVSPTRKILCLPTKRHWKYKSRIEWIDKALYIVARDYEEYGITSLAVPAIGCGKGQLEWEDVHNLIRGHLNTIDISVTVYLP
jgi:O-acetyl-ADP-ribose deacetylase (regulator of RNase III)